MHKKLLKIFGLVALFGVALTGCGTGTEVKNNNKELIFNGGGVAQVGDYIYYPNAYTPVGDDDVKDFAYSTYAKLSYLNRVDLSKGFASNVESPKSTQNIASKVAGYNNTYMFVLGNYVYFTSPSEHENTNPIEHDYTRVSLYRTSLNGGAPTELYYTEQYSSSTAQMRVLKGGDGNYYWVVYDGTDLTGIKIGNQLGSKKVYAKNVLSVAMPNENDEYSVKSIFYTQAQSEGSSDVYAYSLNYSSGASEKVASNEKDLKFVDREGDTIFYTASDKKTDVATYAQTITSSDDLNFSVKTKTFHDTSNVSAVYKTFNDGFVYLAGNLIYKSSASASAKQILKADSFSKILGVQGDWVYYLNGNTIKMLSVRDAVNQGTVREQDIVTAPSEIVGNVSIANGYLYFYSNLAPLGDDDDKTYEETTNNYLYRVQLTENGDYQILSTFTRTEIEE